MAKQSLSHRIHSDLAARELVKMIGYDGQTLPLPEVATNALLTKYGRDHMSDLAKELVDYDTTHNFASLKANVRKLAFGILGPPPEDWHWACPERLPQPKRPTIEEQLADPTIDEVAEALANTIEMETGLGAEVVPGDPPPREPRRYAVPPEMTPQQMISRLSDTELLGLVSDCRFGIAHHKGRRATPFKKDLKLAEAEMQRRGLKERIDPDVELFRKATNHRLEELLDMAQYEVATYSADTATQQEAARHIGLIQEELRRRREGQPDDPFAKLTERQLYDAIHAARDKYNRFSSNSRDGKLASKQIDELHVEYCRRGLAVPVLLTGDRSKNLKQ